VTDRPDEEHRQTAIVAFLGAGLVGVSTAVFVSTLATARRTLTAHRIQHRPVDDWLAAEIRLRGVRENAAVLAMLESGQRRQEVADAYRSRYPDRSDPLDQMLALLA
jgi:hypothetical protein